jgi:hypothetical protein
VAPSFARRARTAPPAAQAFHHGQGRAAASMARRILTIASCAMRRIHSWLLPRLRPDFVERTGAILAEAEFVRDHFELAVVEIVQGRHEFIEQFALAW